ncbi:RsfA family transcriptional regulator [Bacillus sp. Marseille-P3661]|uniref:RsfA family transcriptional regulator n=1 Tax=Bacillus sp. Marseille-P3661 TaxID=1936234 RepID=UPI000C82375C|nr:RsfA family transcriptional regulator [Bacillus sp. Marseille-P3661]
MKVRQDAWSHEDDLLLAETVLRHVREGSTQLNAFEEVGDKLNRTAAACGFRWNAEVRQKYEQAVQLAKKQRKQMKRALAHQSQHFTNNTQSQRTANEIVLQREHDKIESLESTTSNIEMSNEISLDSVILYLQNIKIKGLNSHSLRSENQRLNRENTTLQEEKINLEKKLKRLKEQNALIQEDYQSLVQIMDRARKLVINEDSRPSKSITVNDETSIEQIAK